MKKDNPLYTNDEKKALDSRATSLDDLRIGRFYHNMADWQKKKFNRIANSLAYAHNLAKNRNPLEMMLIRHIALHQVRIDEAESLLQRKPDEKFSRAIDGWLVTMYREIRGAIKDLKLMNQTGKRVKKMDTFSDLRDDLRKEEGLEKSKEKSQVKDGYDRRYYDPVTRTKEQGDEKTD